MNLGHSVFFSSDSSRNFQLNNGSDFLFLNWFTMLWYLCEKKNEVKLLRERFWKLIRKSKITPILENWMQKSPMLKLLNCWSLRPLSDSRLIGATWLRYSVAPHERFLQLVSDTDRYSLVTLNKQAVSPQRNAVAPLASEVVSYENMRHSIG